MSSSRKTVGAIATGSMLVLIANGESSDVWNDCWLRGTVLERSGLGYRCREPSEVRMLSSFISEGNWNLAELETALGKGIAGLASDIQISPDLDRDAYVWGRDCLVKPKIKHILKAEFEETNMSWNADTLWKVPAPPRISL